MNKFLFLTYWRCREARSYSFWCMFGMFVFLVLFCMAVTNYALFGWLPPFEWVVMTAVTFAIPTFLKVKLIQAGETLVQEVWLGRMRLFSFKRYIGCGYWEVVRVSQMYALVYRRSENEDIQLPYRLKYIPLFLS